MVLINSYSFEIIPYQEKHLNRQQICSADTCYTPLLARFSTGTILRLTNISNYRSTFIRQTIQVYGNTVPYALQA